MAYATTTSTLTALWLLWNIFNDAWRTQMAVLIKKRCLGLAMSKISVVCCGIVQLHVMLLHGLVGAIFDDLHTTTASQSSF